MSKLFDTLEEIKHHEKEVLIPRGQVQGEHLPPRSKMPFLLGLILIVAVFGGYNLFQKESLPRSQPTVTALQVPMAVPPNKTTVAPGSSANQAEFYNNKGVNAARKGEFWPAIYYFEKATAVSPQMVEPYINLGTALLKLKLTYPARRYLKKAHGLDPQNAALWDTIHTARIAELLTPEFTEGLAMEDGQ